ncbi:hypothetical protein [Janibacter terrae]|uniref:hypothetical protein n=1 Tax=Janibacter terrae TaxID=103817 RepID=UPI00082B13F8|nr:hypothetical protein [Janibacter terrae]
MTDDTKTERPKRPKKALRPNTAIATGIHPVTRIPLAPTDGLTYSEKPRCETCVHLDLAYEGRTVRDYTCTFVDTFTAVEPEWPGCFKHEPRPET